LRNVVQVNDQLPRAALHEIVGEIVEMLAGLADGEPALDLKVVNPAGFARRNFEWWMKRHEGSLSSISTSASPKGQRQHWRHLHYTMKGMENKSVAARRHAWKVSTEEARAIQEKLREAWEGADRLGDIRTVAGLDAAFVITGPQALQKKSTSWSRLREANRAIGCVVVYRFPEMEEVVRQYAIVPLEFPYIPGLLSFREVPALLAALKKLQELPDVLFCDGQGYAHPRRFGLACHLGVLVDRAAIGCAKSVLIGKHGVLKEKAGNWAELVDDKAGSERIGAVLRTRTGVRPVYISQGHRVSLERAIRLTLAVSDGYRIPRPTRDADHFASEIKRKLLQEELSEK
jgi:deoxyribonuclease V